MRKKPLSLFVFFELSLSTLHAMQQLNNAQARGLRAGVSPRASGTASSVPLPRRTEERRPALVAANASLSSIDRPRQRQRRRRQQGPSRIRPDHGARHPLRSPSPPRVNPFDLAWGTSLPSDIDPQQLAANLFAFSIVPYAGFLFHLHRSRATPKLTLFGFYFLLVFVFGTIPAIYLFGWIRLPKVHDGKILADVDWLHGGAESLLTLTNLFVVLGLRQALREAEKKGKEEGTSSSEGASAPAAAAAEASSSSSPSSGDK